MKSSVALLLIARLLSCVAAQDNTTTAPADPGATTAKPLAPTSKNSISIITPTGAIGYKTGDVMDITWNNLGSTTDENWIYQTLTLELCDASGGANRVSPIGVILSSNASVVDLESKVMVPAGIKPGAKYAVRAAVRLDTGFLYFFSPNFPINQGDPAPSAAGAVSSAAATTGGMPAATSASAKVTVAGTGSSASQSTTTATSKSGSQGMAAGFLGMVVLFL